MVDVLYESNFTADVEASAFFKFVLDDVHEQLVAYYRLEESSGTRADFFNRENLAPISGPGNETGQIGNGVSLGGSGQYLQGSTAPELFHFDGSRDFSFAFWAHVDDVTTPNNEVALGQFNADTGERGWHCFYRQSLDRMQFTVSEDGGTTNNTSAISTVALTNGVNFFCVGRYNSSTGNISIAVNLETPVSVNHGTTINQSTYTFNIGHSQFNSVGNFWDGLVDEVLIWLKDLPANQETALYNTGSGVDVNDLLADVVFFEVSDVPLAEFGAVLTVVEVEYEANVTITADFQAAITINEVELAADVDVEANFLADLSIPVVDFVANVDVTADFDAVLMIDHFFAADVTITADFQVNLFTSDVQAFENPLLGLGGQVGPAGNRLQVAGLSTNIASPAQWTEESLEELNLFYDTGEILNGTVVVAPQTLNAFELSVSTGGDWFGKLYVLPLSVDAGFVVSQQTIPFEVYSSFLSGVQSLDALVNNVDTGVTFSGLPVLPESLDPQTGFVFDVLISPDGPPTIDGTLDFVFNLYTTLVPFTGSRLRLLGVEPEAPVGESLGWRTDVHRASKEREQRISLRNTPRQSFQLTYALDGVDRRVFENLIFDHHGRAFAVPNWIEPIEVTADVSATDTSVQVASTAFRDLRVGGLIAIWEDSQNSEVLLVDSFTDTQINVTTEFAFDHPANRAWIFPTRVGWLSQVVNGSKLRDVIQRYTLSFDALVNSVDLADTSAFSTYKGKVLLDDPNYLGGSTSPGSLERRQDRVDGQVGTFQVFADADVDRDLGSKGWVTRSYQQIWETRQLLHALKGRFTSFFIPTFAKDMVAADTLGIGSDRLVIERFGYADFVQSRPPRNVIRVLFKDGTSLVRTVVGAVNLTATTEELALDDTWPATRQPEEIDRISYVFKARLTSDTIRINHRDARGLADVNAPFISVLE